MTASHVIIGASRGIGLALTEALLARTPHQPVVAAARGVDSAGLMALAERYGDRLQRVAVDVTAPDSVAALAATLSDLPPIGTLIYAAGLLHHPDHPTLPEKKLEDLDWAAMSEVFAVNTLGPAMVLKHCLPLMDREGRAVLAVISARVGSIGDNQLGGWYSYRASKAALNQIMRTAAIEARRRHPNLILTALHPGTTDTALSAPFQKRVPEGKLFSPAFSAERLLAVMDGLTEEDSGGFRAWDGVGIQW
jgi:NAD(P)-dependent dehydrogenase (short-subunit alcohol dehydrogenase family)